MLILDRGVILAIQISVPVLIFFTPNFTEQVYNYMTIAIIALYQMISYSAILYRLYSLRSNTSTKITSCYIYSFTRLFSFFLLLLFIFVFMGSIIFLLKNVQHMIFQSLGISFVSNSLGVLNTFLFFAIFSFFTYFVFILVIIEKKSLYKSLVINYQLIKKMPINLLMQVTILMIFPGPAISASSLHLFITVYLWLLLCTSLSIIIYVPLWDGNNTIAFRRTL